MNLANNKLSGALPKNFAMLSKMEKLILDGNELTGHILPMQYRDMNLELLSLSQNFFRGGIFQNFLRMQQETNIGKEFRELRLGGS